MAKRGRPPGVKNKPKDGVSPAKGKGRGRKSKARIIEELKAAMDSSMIEEAEKLVEDLPRHNVIRLASLLLESGGSFGGMTEAQYLVYSELSTVMGQAEAEKYRKAVTAKK